MKKTLILAALAATIVSPALAQQKHQLSTDVPRWNDSATARTYRSQVYNSVSHIFVGGRDQGTDPDPRVRLQLQRDPPYGGGL